MFYIFSLLLFLWVPQLSAASKKIQCERIYEIVNDATIVLMQNENMSLAKYTSSEVGQKAIKYFPGEQGDEIVALTYLLANRINEDSLKTIQIAKAILDKSGKKYKLEDIIEKNYHEQQRRINEMTVNCVLGSSLKKSNSDDKKFDPNTIL